MKRLRHILIPNSEGDTFEAIELVGTGLAIYREHNAMWKRDEYYLIHIVSGSRLISDFVTTFVGACQLGEYAIAECTSEFDAIERLLDTFAIADHEELFERNFSNAPKPYSAARHL